MSTFKPKIKIERGFIEGYGGRGAHWVKGVYDNRRLFYIESSYETGVAIQGERERRKWEKSWPSKEAFITAIGKKKLDSALCCHCGKSGATTYCLDTRWCQRPKCVKALEAAILESKERQKQQEIEFQKKQEQAKQKRLREIEEACAGFHWQDGWYFKRLKDGSVRIVHRETPRSEWLHTDITIPADHWASIVCAVSSLGENGERFEMAREFHGKDPNP